MAKKPKETTPFKAEPLRGSTLAQMWLDGVEGELHPAEWKLLEACRRGEDCVVDGAERDKERKVIRPTELTEQNHVRAGFLRYLILGGCNDVAIHTRGVRLNGAYVVCDMGANGINELDLEAANIPHVCVIFHCRINGAVNFRGATANSIFFNGSYVNAINGDRLEANGAVYLCDGFEVEGEVRFLGAKLGGNLDCMGGNFSCNGNALICDRLEVKGSVFLNDGFEAEGKVSFIGARITGQLACRNTNISGELYCNGIFVGDGIYLDQGCSIQGEVDFTNAEIKGDLHCEGGEFLSNDKSFTAKRAIITGDVNFNDAKTTGTISFNGAEIGGSLSFNNAKLNGAPSLQMRNAKIGGTFFWRELSRIGGEVFLGGTDCKTISFDRKSWFREFENDKKKPVEENSENGKPIENGDKPKPMRPFTKLDNFTYLGFNDLDSGANAQFWIDWLKVQPPENLEDKFRPKPWSQLAGVLDSMGYEGEAKAVRIERERLLTRFMENHDPEDSSAGLVSSTFWRVWWRKNVWGRLTDYGYNPLKAISFLGGLIIVGWFVFYLAAENGIMAPTNALIYKEIRQTNGAGSIDPVCRENWVWFKSEHCKAQMPSEYSEFSSFMYSADVAIPIIDLRQEDDWSPRVVDHQGKANPWGHFVRVYEWFQILAGWLLSLLVVSAVGGTIRR